MALIYLIRHAETEPLAGQPSRSWKLSEAGFVEAAALAGRRFWPELDRIVTSTEQKAIATAAPAAQLWRLPTEEWDAFDEVRRGGMIDGYEARVRRFFESPFHSPDEWETADDARRRVVEGFRKVRRDYPHENLALVGHGLIWSLLRAHLLGRERVEMAEWRAIRMPDVAVWRDEADGCQLMQDFEGIRDR